MLRTSLPSLVLLVAALGASGSEEPPGSMKLLPGYTARRLQGIDTRVGIVRREDGLTISYDIGKLAGNQAKGLKDEQVLWRKEQTMNGRLVQAALAKDRTLYVTFPEDMANFYGKVATDEDVADFLLMVLTYAPQKPGK